MDLYKTEALELYVRFESLAEGKSCDVQLDWPISYKDRSISLDAARKRQFVNFYRLWDSLKNRLNIPNDADRFVFFVQKVVTKMKGYQQDSDEVKGEIIEISPRFWVNGAFTGDGGVVSRFGQLHRVDTGATRNVVHKVRDP